MTPSFSRRKSALDRACLRAIGFYQRAISPRKGYRCAHARAHGGAGCLGFARTAIDELGWNRAIPHIRARFAACRVAGQTLRAERDCEAREGSPKPKRRATWSDALAITFCDPNWLCCGEALCESGALSGCGDIGCAEGLCGCHACL